MRALVLTGAGRYADPWHPFDETSARLADILRGEGLEVELSGDVDARMAALRTSGDDAPDLLVLNVGDPARAGDLAPEAEARGREGLLAHLGRGRPLLVSHVSVTSLRGIPEWEGILGAIWVRGTSFHPEYGRARILVHPDPHEIVAGLDDFEVDDERYTDLRVAPDVVALASHEHEGREHPLIWARIAGVAGVAGGAGAAGAAGGSRVVVDALGHDTASYDSAEHREILARAVRWLLG